MEKEKQQIIVNETTDYDQFKLLKGNRTVNMLHVEKLKLSFARKYLLSPIIVNENFEIIDGQHRFMAAKELKLPVWYIAVGGYSLMDIQIYNTNASNWKKKDFLNMYVDLGKPAYIKFKEFMDTYPDFGIRVCEALISNLSGSMTVSIAGRNTQGTVFQRGDLEIPDYEKTIEVTEKIMQVKPYYEGFYRESFVKAMIFIFKIEAYDHSKFMERIQANPNSLHNCNKVSEYKLLIEDIYNFRSQKKVSLRYN